ncbi:MAG: DivIVA domain-containing protein [Gemmatimonadota bacterium]|nr:DivIVA domain-containing protein [Gemmatimonadota bacterium]
MIELTPLDVRKKRGDFRKGMRGYDAGEVDTFLEIVAERLEALVKENLTLKERTARLTDQVKEQQDREKAVQDALVTAQALRKDISGQAQREAELMRREAEAEIERMLMDAENRLDEIRLATDEADRRRRRFLRAVRAMLERELDFVSVEEGRSPLEEKPLELDLFVNRPDDAGARRAASSHADDEEGADEDVVDIDQLRPDGSERSGDEPWQPHWRFSMGESQERPGSEA